MKGMTSRKVSDLAVRRLAADQGTFPRRWERKKKSRWVLLISKPWDFFAGGTPKGGSIARSMKTALENVPSNGDRKKKRPDAPQVK